MMSSTTRPIGWKARDYRLQGIDGKTYSRADIRGPNGTTDTTRKWHAPMTHSARLISSASTQKKSCNTAVGSMPRA